MALLAGCRTDPIYLDDLGQGPGPDGGVPGNPDQGQVLPTEPVWHWESPLPQGNNLRGVFAVAGPTTAQDEIYAVGDNSTLLMRVAQRWQQVDGLQNSQGGTVSLLGVTGSGSGPQPELLAVGVYDSAAIRQGEKWSDNSQFLDGFGDGALNAVWGTRVSGEYYVVGTTGRIYHVRGGTSWTREGRGVVTQSLQGVWGSGTATAQEVYAVGGSGTVLHKKNDTWTLEAAGLSAQQLNAVSGIDTGDGNGDIYAVGDAGAVLHRQGGSWVAEKTPTTQGLYGVWVSGTEVYAVGGRGTLLRRSSGTWQVEAPGLSSDLLSAVVGTLHGNDVTIYAVGNLGTVLRRDQGTWTTLSTRVTSFALASVWARSPDEVYAVGPSGTLVRRHGTAAAGTWAPEGTDTTTESLNAVGGWAAGKDGEAEVYAVGTNGTILHRLVGTWTLEGAVLTGEELLGVWVGPDAVFAVGRHGRIARKQAGVWQLEQGSDGMPVAQGDLLSVWGSGQGDSLVVYASGIGGTLLRREKGTWTVEAKGATDQALTAVFGKSADEVYALGALGMALHRLNGKWYPESLNLRTNMERALAGCAVPGSGDLFALSGSGLVLLRGGTSWGLDPQGLTRQVLASISADSLGDVYAVGTGGIVLHRY